MSKVMTDCALGDHERCNRFYYGSTVLPNGMRKVEECFCACHVPHRETQSACCACKDCACECHKVKQALEKPIN